MLTSAKSIIFRNKIPITWQPPLEPKQIIPFFGTTHQEESSQTKRFGILSFLIPFLIFTLFTPWKSSFYPLEGPISTKFAFFGWLCHKIWFCTWLADFKKLSMFKCRKRKKKLHFFIKFRLLFFTHDPLKKNFEIFFHKKKFWGIFDNLAKFQVNLPITSEAIKNQSWQKISISLTNPYILQIFGFGTYWKTVKKS